MAKFYGAIGFGIQSETYPGVWTDTIEERMYRGDIVKDNRKYVTSEGINDNLMLSNLFSIVEDKFAIEKFVFIKYITYMGVKWRVTEVEPNHPRLNIRVGGVYNGQ